MFYSKPFYEAVTALLLLTYVHARVKEGVLVHKQRQKVLSRVVVVISDSKYLLM